jgi:peptide/nickel transport system substrate-binding protein
LVNGGKIIAPWKTYVSVILIACIVGSSFLGSYPIDRVFVDSLSISQTRSDEIIWETVGSPEFLDPHVNYESFGDWIFYNVYETLYTYPGGSIYSEPVVPLLAENTPLVSSDGLNYIIELREGIRFHDGTPFNASCVKWNIERAMKIGFPWGPVWMIGEPLRGGKAVVDATFDDQGHGSPTFAAAFDEWVESSAAINVLDDYVIQFVLEEPYPAFISVLSTPVGSMMSPSYAIAHASDPSLANWENYGVDYAEFDNHMSEHMCGTGPYQESVWAPYEYILLDINEEYWRDTTDTMAGSIRHVLIRMNEDTNSRQQHLRDGLIDGCYWPKEEAPEISSPTPGNSTDPNLHVSYYGFSFQLLFAGFNMGTIHVGDVDYPSPFSNLHFRRAVSYAFQYDDFIDEELMGFGFQAQGPIPYGMFGHNGSAFDWEYNLTLAVKEWNLAMTDPNFVDVLNLLDNQIELNFIITSHEPSYFYPLMVLALMEIWEHQDANQTGLNNPMDCFLAGIDWSTYYDAISQRRLLVYLMSWIPDFADPDDFLFPTIYHKGVYANMTCYNNTYVNTLYELQRVTDTQNERLQTLDLLQEAVAQDIPYLWLAQKTEFRVWRSWLQGDGLEYNPMHDIYFYHIYKVGVTNPIFQDPLQFYLILGIAIEIVIIATLIVYRYSKRSQSGPTI